MHKTKGSGAQPQVPEVPTKRMALFHPHDASVFRTAACCSLIAPSTHHRPYTNMPDRASQVLAESLHPGVAASFRTPADRADVPRATKLFSFSQP